LYVYQAGYLYSTMAFVKRLVNQPVFSQALVAVIADGVMDVHRNICHIDPPPEL
jgi:capsid protein